LAGRHRYVQPTQTSQARLVHDHGKHAARDVGERRRQTRQTPRRDRRPPLVGSVRPERHVRRGRRRPVQLHRQAGAGRDTRQPAERGQGAGAVPGGGHRGRVRRAVRHRARVQRSGVLRRVPAVRQEERAQPGAVSAQPVHRQLGVRRHHHVRGVHAVHAVGAHVPPLDMGPDHVQDCAGRPGRQHNRVRVYHNRHRSRQVHPLTIML